MILIYAASPADQYDVIEEDVLTLSDAKQLADRNSNVPSQDFAARLLYFYPSHSFEIVLELTALDAFLRQIHTVR